MYMLPLLLLEMQILNFFSTFLIWRYVYAAAAVVVGNANSQIFFSNFFQVSTVKSTLTNAPTALAKTTLLGKEKFVYLYVYLFYVRPYSIKGQTYN